MPRERVAAGARAGLLFAPQADPQPEVELQAVPDPVEPPAAAVESSPLPEAPAPPSPPAASPAPTRVRSRRTAALTRAHGDDQLVKTSQKFSKADLRLFEQLAHQAWQEGPEKLTRDHLVRCLLRAVLDLDLDLDLAGLTLADQDELVERMRIAVADALSQHGYR